MLYLTPHDARRFLSVIQDDPLEPLYTLAMTTGMRLGELLGLRWQAVDGTDLQVRVTLTRTAAGWSLTEPKTPKSRRRIALSSTATAALRRQKVKLAEARLRAGEAWADHGLVFTDAFGEPLFGSRITERRLRPVLRRAELPLIRFHDLRHTAATLMLSAGVHPKVVSEMLGHSSVAITLDRYSHVVPTMREEAALRIDQLLSAPVRVQTRVPRVPRARKSPNSSVNRGRRVRSGTAYRMRGIPCHASQQGHGGQAWAAWDVWNKADKGSDRGSAELGRDCPGREQEIADPARLGPVFQPPSDRGA